jgi:hypothetical protein
LGKAVAFIDATGRWAIEWLVDEQSIIMKFIVFVKVGSYTINNVSALDVQIKSPQANTVGFAEIVVDRDLVVHPDYQCHLNGYALEYSDQPSGESQVVSLPQVAPGRYIGKFLPSETGAYLLQIRGAPPDTSQPAVSESIGWVLAYSPEYSHLQSDPDALLRLAAAANTPRSQTGTCPSSERERSSTMSAQHARNLTLAIVMSRALIP